MFKLLRKFPEAQIVAEVFYKARHELFCFAAMMLLLSSCVGLLLHDVNMGRPCYIGDDSCPTSFVNSDAYASYPEGRRVLVTPDGKVPSIPNGFVGLWFAMVTIGTVGYGDVLPEYFFKYAISLILMIIGSFLFAIPISIISRHYSAGYAAIQAKQQKRHEMLASIVEGNRRKGNLAVMRARRRQ